MPCIPALDPLVSALSRYLGATRPPRGSARTLRLDNDYFNRMDALNYAIGHDDGQGGQDLEQADVVLVGVVAHLQDADLHLPGPPRRARRPMCRWCRAAPPPEQLFDLKSAAGRRPDRSRPTG